MISTTVNGGEFDVRAGGVASGVVVGASLSQLARFSSFGRSKVYAGGTASNAVVSSGGVLSSFGSTPVLGAVISNGGPERILQNGIAPGVPATGHSSPTPCWRR